MSDHRVSCPNCEASLRSSADPSTSVKIRCPHCQHVFRVGPPPSSRPAPVQTAPTKPPKRRSDEDRVTARKNRDLSARDNDDEEIEDRPARKRKRPAEKGSRRLLLVGLLLGVLLLGGGALAFVLLRKNDPAEPVVKKEDNNKPPSDRKDDGKPPPDVKKPNPVVKVEPDLPAKARLDADDLARVKKATVYIRVKDGDTDTWSTGSGFFGIKDHYVITNAHVMGMLDTNSRPRIIDHLLDRG